MWKLLPTKMVYRQTVFAQIDDGELYKKSFREIYHLEQLHLSNKSFYRWNSGWKCSYSHLYARFMDYFFLQILE